MIVGFTFCGHCDQSMGADEHTCRRCGHTIVAEINDLLAEDGEPPTCLEEVERLPEWIERRAA